MSDSLQLVCPQCHSVNRLPSARLQHSPKCGHCKQALFRGSAVELTSVNFAKHISRNDIPLVVDFWAPWCGPCKMMAPQVTQAAGLMEPQIRFAKVNTEVEQSLGAEYGIRSIPTLALFKAGREVARQAGAMNSQDIVRWVRNFL